jgi:hypothetical protein
MSLVMSGSKRLLTLKMFQWGARDYLEKNKEIFDKYLTGLSETEFTFVRSMVLSEGERLPPGNHLSKKLSAAVEAIKVQKNFLIRYYEEGGAIVVLEKLNEWNSLANLPRPELVRKIEGAGKYIPVFLRSIKLYGKEFVDLVALCNKFRSISLLSVLKGTVREMSNRGWKGVITPKMVFVLNCIETSLQMPVEHGGIQEVIYE